MLIDTKLLESGLATVSISGDLAAASAVHPLTDAITYLTRQGRRGILLDLAKVQRMSMAGLAALVELAARHPRIDLGFCALPKKKLDFLRKSGLDRGLPVFASVEEALAQPQFRAHALTGTRAVLLCAGKGSRVAPLTDVTPKPMLDIAGRPAMHRIIEHLQTFGLHDILLNPGHLGDQVIEYFRATPMPDTRITYVNEGVLTPSGWQARPIGSASTLKRMQNQNAAFESDLVVLCGDALIDIDLAEMMREHRASGAVATIAARTVAESEVHKYGIIEAAATQTITRFVEKPQPGVTESRLANTGIYIFKSQVLDLLSNDEGLDIACDLLPAIMAAGGKMRVYQTPFSWVDIGCGRDFAQATFKCLKGEIPSAAPEGIQVRPGVWAMPGAYVSPRAKITGRCHVGAGARIEAGAQLDGICSIGADAIVEGDTVLRDCIVMPRTRVGYGAWANDMILHGDWAVDHTRADGSTQDCHPMDCIAPIKPEALLERPENLRATA